MHTITPGNSIINSEDKKEFSELDSWHRLGQELKGIVNITIWVSGLLLVILLLSWWLQGYFPQIQSFTFFGETPNDNVFQTDYFRGEIKSIPDLENFDPEQIEVSVFLADNNETVKAFTSISDRNFFTNSEELTFNIGDQIIVSRINGIEGGDSIYVLHEIQRISSAMLAIVLFIFLAVVFAGIRGITSVYGLMFSMLVLIGFIVPMILEGNDPLLITTIGGIVIVFFSLYFAHGVSVRTTLSVLSTLGAIIFSVGIAVFLVNLTSVFGLGSEEALYLESAGLGEINLQGILLASIIIGAIGVLDDITTAQTATVEEIAKLGHNLGFRQLYKRGISVGKEHISSLINTLVLAYAGSAFPLFILLVSNNNQPLWVSLNSEPIMEELVRALAGSATLILAVPVSTALAAYYYSKKRV